MLRGDETWNGQESGTWQGRPEHKITEGREGGREEEAQGWLETPSMWGRGSPALPSYSEGSCSARSTRGVHRTSHASVRCWGHCQLRRGAPEACQRAPTGVRVEREEGARD